MSFINREAERDAFKIDYEVNTKKTLIKSMSLRQEME